MNNIKKYLFVAGLAVIMHNTLVYGASRPSEYYSEPQIYSNRPNPNNEMAFCGSIGVTGIETRIYKGVAVIGSPTRGRPYEEASHSFERRQRCLTSKAAKAVCQAHVPAPPSAPLQQSPNGLVSDSPPSLLKLGILGIFKAYMRA